VCLCSHIYPACNAYGPYYRLWPVRVYNIFPRYLINGTIFGKKAIEHKMSVSIFSTTSVWNISHSKKNSTRYDQKYILVFWYPLLLSDINENCVFSTGFREIFKYKILWKSVKWEPSWSMRKDGQTDRHDEANSRFRSFAKASKNSDSPGKYTPRKFERNPNFYGFFFTCACSE